MSGLKHGIAMHACDDCAAVEEVKQYLSDEAWEAVSEMMASINTLTWCLHIDSCSTTIIGLKSIKYKGPKLWNELPCHLKYCIAILPKSSPVSSQYIYVHKLNTSDMVFSLYIIPHG